jgi:hypothetical protein
MKKKVYLRSEAIFISILVYDIKWSSSCFDSILRLIIVCIGNDLSEQWDE